MSGIVWNGELLPTPLCEDGSGPLNGVAVVHDFAQDHLRFDPERMYEELIKLNTWRRDEPIDRFGPLKWVDGDHFALHFRDQALPRKKLWFAEDREHRLGLLKYTYSGWQWSIAPATRPLSDCKIVQTALERVNEKLSEDLQMNHVIVTNYESERKCITWHSDSESDIDPASVILVVKIGPGRRDFAIRRKSDRKVVWRQPIGCGDAIFMSMEANRVFEHSVPKSRKALDPSGSLVLRRICSRIPWHVANEKLKKAACDAGRPWLPLVHQ